MSLRSRAVALTAFLAIGAGGLVALSVRGMSSASPSIVRAAQPTAEDLLRQRGAYLMAAIGCQDCHSPRDATGKFIPGAEFTGHPADAPLPEWEPDDLKRNILMTMSPTGTAFAGPWGVSVAPNLTPDKETGIGNLTAEALIRSWRTNKHWKHPRDIAPPMPAPMYASLSDDDIRALHAFLMSLMPVKNKAPESIIHPPQN